MWRSTLRMAFWLFITFLLASQPRITPPGNVWTPLDYVAVAVLIFGAYNSAGAWRRRYVYVLYGCLGACVFLPVLLPDNRDYISIGRGQESIESYLIRTCLFIAVMGFVCGVAATVRHMRQAPVAHADSPRCEKCGYLLYGLTENRCPECGTPFNDEIPPAPR